MEKKIVFIDKVILNVSMSYEWSLYPKGIPAVLDFPILKSRNISICCAINKCGIIVLPSDQVFLLKHSSLLA